MQATTGSPNSETERETLFCTWYGGVDCPAGSNMRRLSSPALREGGLALNKHGSTTTSPFSLRVTKMWERNRRLLEQTQPKRLFNRPEMNYSTSASRDKTRFGCSTFGLGTEAATTKLKLLLPPLPSDIKTASSPICLFGISTIMPTAASTVLVQNIGAHCKAQAAAALS